MRSVFIFTLLVSAFILNGQQFYTVVSTEGSIRTDKAVALKPGVRIDPETKLMLNIPNSRVLLIGNDAKTYEIRVPRIPSHKPLLCKDVIGKPNYSHNVSSNNLKNRLDGMDFNVLGNMFSVRLKDSNYPIADGSYFFISFSHGTKTVNHRIPVQNDHLVFAKNRVFSYAGSILKTSKVEDITLYYQSSTNNSSSVVATFDLNFMEQSTMIHDESFLVSAYNAAGITDTETIIKKSIEYFKDAYGDFDQGELTEFVASIVR